ncbi:hypothetical protein EMIT043CA1_270082 [Pseudomonas brassicacearum]
MQYTGRPIGKPRGYSGVGAGFITEAPDTGKYGSDERPPAPLAQLSIGDKYGEVLSPKGNGYTKVYFHVPSQRGLQPRQHLILPGI